jgi:hypothetical protein
METTRILGSTQSVTRETVHRLLPIVVGLVMGPIGCALVSTARDDATISAGKAKDPAELAVIKKCSETLSQAETAAPRDPRLQQCQRGLPPGSLCQVDIEGLSPTQTAVGMEQVELKAVKIRRMIMAGSKASGLAEYLRNNPQPIVVGPGGTLYIIDHHHLARALLITYVPRTYGRIVRDLSGLSQNEFWATMERCRWVYPFSPEGARLASFDQLPKTIRLLGDDPFRALAGFVRKAKGFDKVNEPFVEFLWAERFRSKLKISETDQLPITAEQITSNFAKAAEAALKFAKSTEAADLPGYNVAAGEVGPAPAKVQQDDCRIPAALP